ncbi:MAG TPA: AAA family ATPase [Verrucomicrobiae bacterium]|nr:AAA family ATPase [Verrucomicrobiae bacterium]
MGRLNKQLNPALTGSEAEKLDRDLRRRIVGQDEAVRQIISVYQTYLAGMATPGRPVGNLLFLGPTGSGKTRLVEATAESLVGDARAVIKIDCAEFQHSHEIAKLIGSPPGYLGHRETHPLLSQEVLNQYHTEKVRLSFVLFDEIEKASDALWNLLLGILDKATLTLGDNRRVDFSKALIFMTSNLGASEMNSLLRPNLGFTAAEAERKNAAGVVDESLTAKVERTGVEAARKKFTPEFMNRIDKVVVFHPLGEKELRQILNIELNAVQERVFHGANAAPFVFTVTDQAKGFLLQEGTDMKYGARHLKRAVDRNLVHPMSNLIATGQIRGGDLLRVDFDGEMQELTFFKDAEDMPTHEMARMAGVPAIHSAEAVATGASVEQTRAASAKTTKR